MSLIQLLTEHEDSSLLSNKWDEMQEPISFNNFELANTNEVQILDKNNFHQN